MWLSFQVNTVRNFVFPQKRREPLSISAWLGFTFESPYDVTQANALMKQALHEQFSNKQAYNLG